MSLQTVAARAVRRDERLQAGLRAKSSESTAPSLQEWEPMLVSELQRRDPEARPAAILWDVLLLTNSGCCRHSGRLALCDLQSCIDNAYIWAQVICQNESILCGRIACEAWPYIWRCQATFIIFDQELSLYLTLRIPILTASLTP